MKATEELNKCDLFDQIGISILNGLVSFDTQTKNPDRYGWWDNSGTTISNQKILNEIKCNHSSQLYFDTTVLTKKDFDQLVNGTPDDVTPLYFSITNRYTFCFNLRKIAADPSVYEIKTKYAVSTKYGNNPYMRDEVWIYFDRKKCRDKGYMTLIKKGGKTFGYDIDKLLRVG
ncbi:hypothetical protein [Pedobacter sp. N23S346]|uniref:hypothetical protein n=1 Tax=Pedobacter sp. N23S346 TaxID=3402750 RepID=UPI003AD34AE8